MRAPALTVAITAILLAGCGGGEDSSTSAGGAEAAAIEHFERGADQPHGKPPKNLVIKDLKVGTGAEVKPNDELTVKYIGIRWNGEPFLTDGKKGGPNVLTFQLNNDPPEASPGWEKGVLGMKVGGRRELIVPPKLFYYPGQVPNPPNDPEATLSYVMELLAIK